MTTPTAQLDTILLALADPTRRSILEQLRSGEKRVTDLAAPHPISLNSVSKHIRVLERADLVRRRQVGREHLLTANPEPLGQPADWIAQQRAFWTTQFDNLEAMLADEDRQASQG